MYAGTINLNIDSCISWNQELFYWLITHSSAACKICICLKIGYICMPNNSLKKWLVPFQIYIFFFFNLRVTKDFYISWISWLIKSLTIISNIKCNKRFHHQDWKFIQQCTTLYIVDRPQRVFHESVTVWTKGLPIIVWKNYFGKFQVKV